MPHAHTAEARKPDQLVFGDGPHGKAFHDAVQASAKWEQKRRRSQRGWALIPSFCDGCGAGFEPATFGYDRSCFLFRSL
jgi:hypothetical protein